ncbi:protein SAWADEE HOMEODOMAIN HOMOLOG 1-like isoform X2 [Cucumis melo]|uniref:Protein SAWADEE HOMEODOMAIN HOMOLOG 1-like isoform X2 n=1 Tax=Cucumis melo TaxID=3656 RepID=A0ABM3KNY5_CUCME|nr:protein SAWADEE HOMEODOMAIN HOMOLOG 1-like isoform X2 [Cucumis melo]
MERLRPRGRQMFSGFTKGEIEKMEKLLEESGEQSLNRDFCQKVTKRFNRSSGRAGKPVIKWTEVYDWLQSRLQDLPKIEKRMSEIPKACPSNKTQESSQGPEVQYAWSRGRLRQSLHLAKRALICRNWNLKQGHQKMVHGMMLPCSLHIDFLVLAKLVHRFVEPSELIVHQACRFVGFGAEEDEWVNIKQAVRERSVPLEHSECQKVKAGDLVLCFQERRDQAIYYDAHIVEVQRRMHDIRGCRCLFLVRYDHDSTEEKVRLRRLCRRPTYQI